MSPQSSPSSLWGRVDVALLTTLIILGGMAVGFFLGVQDMIDRRDTTLRKNAVMEYQHELIHRGVAHWGSHPETGKTTLVIDCHKG